MDQNFFLVNTTFVLYFMNPIHITNSQSFFSQVWQLQDKGRTTDIIYLDLSKKFDAVPQHTLVTKLEKMDLTDRPLAG